MAWHSDGRLPGFLFCFLGDDYEKQVRLSFILALVSFYPNLYRSRDITTPGHRGNRTRDLY